MSIFDRRKRRKGQPMKGYKGFSNGLICNKKQYAENTVFEEPKAVICRCGMHFCENPLDVLDYYPLVDENGVQNEFAEVEALAGVHTDDKKKFCTTKLKIGAKLSFAGFVKAAIDFVFEKCNGGEVDTGDSSQLAASGYSSQLAASGDSSKLAASGDSSVVAGIGINNIAKAALGCWITLAEWEYSNEKKRHIPVCVKTEQVDGERIKADVFYKLKNGEFVEVKENARKQ